jgi:hypothetical protein
LIDTKLELIFVRNPKTATQAIQNSLFGWTNKRPKHIINLNHLSVDAIAKKYPEQWKRFYKFTCIRHPVDRIISMFHYLKKYKPRVVTLSFEDWVKADFPHWEAIWSNEYEAGCNIIHQTSYTSGVDFIVRYESLTTDLKILCEQTGLEIPELKIVNSSNRDRNTIPEISNSEVMDILNEKFRMEYQLFGYAEFEPGMIFDSDSVLLSRRAHSNSLSTGSCHQVTPIANNDTASFSLKEIQKQLSTFSPASAGANNHPELTISGAERFPNALAELCDKIYSRPTFIHFQEFNTEITIAKSLLDLFTFYKTDKGLHNYHLLYGEILFKLGINKSLNILEIGLGTNNPNKVSHMNANFQPGASLRSFRDIASRSQIYGADIDKDILFFEDRIKTTWVDQMQYDSFNKMNTDFGDISYDLIIDDGLHSISANLNTLLFSLSVLKPGGWVVIEDIWSGQQCWDVIYRLIPPMMYNCFLITFNTSKRVFALEKLV